MPTLANSVQGPRSFHRGKPSESPSSLGIYFGGHPKAEDLFCYLSAGVDVRDFFFHFQGKYFYSSIPPRNFFPNAKNCVNHKDFVSSCIIDRVKNGSLLVHGKVGSVDPPHLVMPITVELTKPRMCHNEQFLNLWIKDSPFSLDYITNLPRYVGLSFPNNPRR